MRKIFANIVIIFSVVVAFAQYTVDEVKISCQKDTTTVQILTSAPPDFKKFAIENPPKLGVDFFNAKFNLPQKEYLQVPPGIVMAVRASQYKSAPQPVVRVVLDLTEMPGVYDVHPLGGGNGVEIKIPTPGYPAIKEWTTGRLAPPETMAVAPKESVAAETLAAKPESLAAPETTAAETAKAVPVTEEVPPELAVFLRPETLIYKGITADNETIEVAKYIRNMVVYTPKGEDPFVTPSPGKKVPIGQEPVPAVDKLSVVGIVEIGGRKIALMQDESGFGYVIGPGDTVEDGRCTEVTDTSAKFDLIEFGQIRKVEIPLVKPKK